MEQCKIVNMYDLNETIAKEYMETAEYPWELLDGLSDYIKRLGATLDPEKYENGRKSRKNFFYTDRDIGCDVTASSTDWYFC